MDPESIKSWSNAITAPALLVVIGFVSWRFGKFLMSEFVVPLGGNDGSIAKFLERTGEAVAEGPKAVEQLHASFRDIAGENVALLRRVIKLQERHHQCFSDMPPGSKINDSIRAKKLIAAMVEKISRSPNINVDLSDELARVNELLDKYDRIEPHRDSTTG